MIEIEIDKSVYLPCYHHMLDKDDDVLLLWGGRDSGKTHYIAQRLVEKCLTAEYFRCVLVRESFNTIKDSQWQAIKDVVEDYGMEELFIFKIAPLEIICKNGNRFICRGCDDPAKIKSVKDPTDAWYEECDKMTHADYTTISTTLRSNKAKIQEWLSFNPEHTGDLEEFWIYKLFFKDAPNELNFSRTKTIEFKVAGEIRKVDIRYTSCHTTYHDNPFCSPQRIAKLEELAITDPYYYSVYTLGLWGTRKIENPFCTQYDPVKHESEEAIFKPGVSIIFIFDFNIDPFSLNLAHIWRDEKGEHCHVFDEMTIESGSIPKLCDEIRLKYGKHLHLCRITGDAMGSRREISQRDHSSSYMQIQRTLKISPTQFKLPSNPTHKNSRSDVNYVLYHFPDFKINPKRCPNTCRDMKIVQCDVYGEMVSITKANRRHVDQRADHLDNMRYLINTFLKKWIVTHQNIVK